MKESNPEGKKKQNSIHIKGRIKFSELILKQTA